VLDQSPSLAKLNYKLGRTHMKEFPAIEKYLGMKNVETLD
jgi:urate oxidase